MGYIDNEVPTDVSTHGRKLAEFPAPVRPEIGADESAWIDFYWQELAHRAVEGNNSMERRRMRDEVFRELRAGNALNACAIRWLDYQVPAEPLNQWIGRSADRAEYDRKELLLVQWCIKRGIEAPSQDLEDAAYELGMSSDTWSKVAENETFAITLLTLKLQGRK